MRVEKDVAGVLRCLTLFCLVSTPPEEPIRGKQSAVDFFQLFLIFNLTSCIVILK